MASACKTLDGRNIYVRPERTARFLALLVDDLTADAVKRMKMTGFTPAAVIETSPGNFQAWLKHPRQLPRELSTMAARKLAEEFGGDRGAADWRHFGRLAGFTNRKAKYMTASGLFPFVRLIEAPGIRYPEGERFEGRFVPNVKQTCISESASVPLWRHPLGILRRASKTSARIHDTPAMIPASIWPSRSTPSHMDRAVIG